MTNKEQIIINGVDVSECEYLTNQLEEDGQYYWFCKISPTGGPDECEYNPKCFYKRVLKQLARKTQECEKLKKCYSELTDIVSPYMDDFTGYNEELGGFDIALCVKELMEQLDQLKAENEELKEKNQELEMQLCNDCGERDDYNIPCKMIRDLDYGLQKEIEENDRYRKALEEIEAATKINCEEICGRKFTDCNDTSCFSVNILDIINNAKGEKNE